MEPRQVRIVDQDNEFTDAIDALLEGELTAVYYRDMRWTVQREGSVLTLMSTPSTISKAVQDESGGRRLPL